MMHFVGSDAASNDYSGRIRFSANSAATKISVDDDARGLGQGQEQVYRGHVRRQRPISEAGEDAAPLDRTRRDKHNAL